MARPVYIVRHGNTFDKGDTVTRVGARTDLPLSVSGQAQAVHLADWFAKEDILFTHACSSPLRRTMQTAEAILSRQPGALPVHKTPFLKEIDYGVDENRPEAEVVARIGQAALDRWEREAVVPDGWLAEPDQIRQGWQDLFNRLAGGLQDGPALVVTSNGIARFALQVAEPAKGSAHELKLKTGAFGRIDLDAGGAATVAQWNIRP